jgi:mannose/cellobiose epimerase-like protein (N-acyl-D-glucosamine 2-epimerase family)
LFDCVVAHGGLCYGFAPDGAVCDDDKYFWVQTESLAAAARLAQHTGDARYRDWYERLWRHAGIISSTMSTAPGIASSIAATGIRQREKPRGQDDHHT